MQRNTASSQGLEFLGHRKPIDPSFARQVECSSQPPVLGLIFAYMASLLLRTFLYDVTLPDPWTMAAVTLLLVVGGIGCLQHSSAP